MQFIFVLVFAKDSYWLNYRAYFKNQPISVSTLSQIPKSVFVFFVTPVTPTLPYYFTYQDSSTSAKFMPHCVIFRNCRFLTFYQEPIKIYLLLYSSNLVSHFLL